MHALIGAQRSTGSLETMAQDLAGSVETCVGNSCANVVQLRAKGSGTFFPGEVKQMGNVSEGKK